MKTFEQIYENKLEPLQEMALLGLVKSNPRTLPKGMRIEVITKEFKETGEEPHFHLFPANHIPKSGNANNYDLITRVALTEEQPKDISYIRPIAKNNPIPKEYKNAIFNWSQENDDETGVNNWKLARTFWNKQVASVHSGQL